MTMGADPVACAALAAGADVKAFFVRKDRKQHGLQRWVEGPLLEPGERCLIVEDVVTTGGSTVQAIERVREEGFEIAAVTSVLDRLAGGAEAIEAAAGAPYRPLTTIDDVYPDRPDESAAEPAVDQPPGDRVRRGEERSRRARRRRPRPPRARTSAPPASSPSPGRGSPPPSALKPIISELGNGQGCEAT